MNRFKKIWIQLDSAEQSEIKAEALNQIKNMTGSQEARIRHIIKKLVFSKK